MINKLFLNTFVSLLPFCKQSMMSFEDRFDSNTAYSITSKQIQLSEIACELCLKTMKTSRFLDFMKVLKYALQNLWTCYFIDY